MSIDTDQEKGLILTIQYITGLSEHIKSGKKDHILLKLKILYPLPPSHL